MLLLTSETCPHHSPLPHWRCPACSGAQTSCDRARPVLVVFLGTFSLSWCWIPVTGLHSCRCWGLPAAVTLFLPVTIAPGQLPCELLEPSDIFQHISFSGREKCLAARAAGKGQAQQYVCITSFHCSSWRVSAGLAGAFGMASQKGDGCRSSTGPSVRPSPFAKWFGWMQEQAGGCRGSRTFPVPRALEWERAG